MTRIPRIPELTWGTLGDLVSPGAPRVTSWRSAGTIRILRVIRGPNRSSVEHRGPSVRNLLHATAFAAAWPSDPAARPLMPKPRAVVVALLPLVAALAGCGGDDPEKLTESLDSWSATVRTATSAVHLGWVPRRYAAQIRDRATAALNDAREKGAGDATPDQARAVTDAEQRLDAAVDTLSAAVGS